MHIHPPKPLHGWREFLNEVLIIVVGILIALTLENVVERLRWREQTEIGRDNVKFELQRDTMFAWERVALAPCLRQRLHFLADQVTAGTEVVDGARLRLVDNAAEDAMPRVYLTPNRPFDHSAWENLLTSGAYSHVDRLLAARLADTYTGVKSLTQVQGQEDAAVARLTPLAYSLPLSTTARAEMLSTLGDVDRINSMITLLSGQMLTDVADLKLGFNSESIENRRVHLLASLRRNYGACVEDRPLKI